VPGAVRVDENTGCRVTKVASAAVVDTGASAVAATVPVSVLILTLNEELNIQACLSALRGFDDILVLDSFSTDRTVQIAEAMGARTHRRAFDNFAGQRNFALEQLGFKHEWVLHLDADEVLTAELRDEIQRAIQNPACDAYRVPSRLMFLGQWLRYSGMYPTYQVRLGRKDKLRFVQVGHGQRETLDPQRIGTLKNAYLHHSFSKGLPDWFERHNRYSTDEAREAVARRQDGREIDWIGLASLEPTRRRRAFKDLSAVLPFRPLLRFLYMYVLRLGFLDGRAGWTYCRMLAIYEFMIVAKTREMMRERGLPPGGPDKTC
jgi:glycosyltransferase involved in cell wall biosynthesis